MAFELVATPALFAFFGYLIDRAAGTSRIFVLVLPIVVAIYMIWKLLADYNAKMAEFDAELPSRRTRSADG